MFSRSVSSKKMIPRSWSGNATWTSTKTTTGAAGAIGTTGVNDNAI